jgi:hypothetical protein
VWAASEAQKSVPIGSMAPLFDVRGVQFISLQKEPRPGDEQALSALPQVTRLGEEFEDFADTAALVSMLDLVISVDTSVAHLAGALGKPVWVLLQHTADWRWHLDRSDSPWYPTARLFRQRVAGDWLGVVADVCEALTRL